MYAQLSQYISVRERLPFGMEWLPPEQIFYCRRLKAYGHSAAHLPMRWTSWIP
jgi:hypothetical protein